MTRTMSWAARAVLTGLLAAGTPGIAAADETPPSSAADAISQCLVEHGFPPLAAGSALVPPPGTVLAPVPSGGSAPGATTPVAVPGLPAGATPAAIPGLPAGTTPAAIPGLPAGAVPTAIPTVPTGTTTAADGSTGVPCGQVIINNTLYMVLVTVTTTTTTVAAPITAAGSITTTNAAPATVLTGPPSDSSPGASGIGTALRVRRGTTHARSRRNSHRHAHVARRHSHIARVWLVRSAPGR